MSGHARTRLARVTAAALLTALVAGVLTVGTPTVAAAFPNFFRVNFQPSAAAPATYWAEPVPGTSSSYRIDSGEAFGTRAEGYSYGWVAPGTSTPRALTDNPRDRGTDQPQRWDTFIHMQPPTGSGSLAGSWEVAVPNGPYTVIVGVGDASHIDSRHRVAVEGTLVIEDFVATEPERFRHQTTHVTVSDGRLTVSAEGGQNTKLAFLELYNGHRPYVTQVLPGHAALGVGREGEISASIQVVSSGDGVDPATLTPGNVRLVRTSDGTVVAATRGTSGGNDVITLDADGVLQPDTEYRFEVDHQVKSVDEGRSFAPFWTTFRTGTALPGSTETTLTRVAQPQVPERFYTSVVMGPDDRLYASTSSGSIFRFDVAPDGNLSSPQEITTVRKEEGTDRIIIGLAFDPAATAEDLTLWVSHSTDFEDPDPWGGTISRLSGATLADYAREVVRLPRSTRDHLTNGLAFGPDGALYVSQGANTAGGAADPQWGNRAETVLTAAVLRIDTGQLAGAAPLNVQTEGVANPYDPRPAGAPVRVFASGVRNAYDLVWAGNGQLYTTINGTAGEAIAPQVDAADLPSSCSARLVDGRNYTGPSVPGIGDLPIQPDLAARIVSGGYYGNPNPARCEWVLNGGNPTSRRDVLQVAATGGADGYPVGVQPDPNWRPDLVYRLGTSLSPNGIIEYTNAGTPELDGTLMAAAFSNCNCILVMDRDDAGNVTDSTPLDTGSFSFDNPLDVTTGDGGVLYVIDRADRGDTTGSIELLRP